MRKTKVEKLLERKAFKALENYQKLHHGPTPNSCKKTSLLAQ